LRGSFPISMRSRDVFRNDPALGIPITAYAALRFRACTRKPLGPRPRVTILSGESTRRGFVSPIPPTDFCNYVYDARAHPTSDPPSPRAFPTGISTGYDYAFAFASRATSFKVTRPAQAIHFRWTAAGESHETQQNTFPGSARTPRSLYSGGHRPAIPRLRREIAPVSACGDWLDY